MLNSEIAEQQKKKVFNKKDEKKKYLHQNISHTKMVTAAMKLKDLTPWKKSYDQPR